MAAGFQHTEELCILTIQRFADITSLLIATTHGFTVAILGSGLAAAGTEVATETRGRRYFLPLPLNPYVAVLSEAVIYPYILLARV